MSEQLLNVCAQTHRRSEQQLLRWDVLHFFYLNDLEGLFLCLCHHVGKKKKNRVANQTKSTTTQLNVGHYNSQCQWREMSAACLSHARRESCDVFSRGIWREVQSTDRDRPKQLDSWVILRPESELESWRPSSDTSTISRLKVCK